LILIGVPLLVLPGPGLALIGSGVLLLASDRRGAAAIRRR
jgi:hypothetical protein